MTRDEILTEVYNSNIIQKLSSKYLLKLGDNAEEFVSYCLLIICEIPEEKLIKLYNDGQLYFYIFAIAKNQCWNEKSEFNTNIIENNIEKIAILDAKDYTEEF